MFHQHILSRADHELIKKVYLKQKESPLKGDWYQMLIKDFKFIEEDLNDDKVNTTEKEEYRKIVKEKVKTSAFKYLIKEKEKSKKKLRHVKYGSLEMQPYIKSKHFTMQENILLFSLRSGCHPAKLNFRKMNKGNLMCSLKCENEESQTHIFESCKPILEKLDVRSTQTLNKIFGTQREQKEAITVFVAMEDIRRQLLKEQTSSSQVV